MPGGQVVVGGFGDVEQAKLRRLPFGWGPVVALKKLRPDGDRNRRIRVIAVSTTRVRAVLAIDTAHSPQALARELLIWSKLTHRNILPLGGFYLDEPSLKAAWIVTFWHDNGNMKQYLTVRNPDEKTRLQLVRNILYDCVSDQ